MAAITFNTADQEEQVRRQIKAALAAYREMLDAFAGNQTRPAAEETGQIGPRQIPGTKSLSKDAP